jgi:hypothetical protein
VPMRVATIRLIASQIAMSSVLDGLKVSGTVPCVTTNFRGRPTPNSRQALVLKRNEIIHRRRPRIVSTCEPLIDAWRLSAWYSELAILRLGHGADVVEDVAAGHLADATRDVLRLTERIVVRQ